MVDQTEVRRMVSVSLSRSVSVSFQTLDRTGRTQAASRKDKGSDWKEDKKQNQRNEEQKEREGGKKRCRWPRSAQFRVVDDVWTERLSRQSADSTTHCVSDRAKACEPEQATELRFELVERSRAWASSVTCNKTSRSCLAIATTDTFTWILLHPHRPRNFSNMLILLLHKLPQLLLQFHNQRPPTLRLFIQINDH